MPELPDVVVYVEALSGRIVGRRLVRASVRSPFVLRTFDPPIESLEDRDVRSVGRIGKRIVLEFAPSGYLVIHLMIAGRLRWADVPGGQTPTSKAASREPHRRRVRVKSPPDKITLARFSFASEDGEVGELSLTEASMKKRAAMHVLEDQRALAAMDPGGLELLDPRQTHCLFHAESATDARLRDEFARRLTAGNHTLKRALTNPRDFSGIGNAYSDEILHAARLSPVMLTSRLAPVQIDALFDACRAKLALWLDRLRTEFAGRFPGPGEITAFRPDFSVHGRYGKPCPDCGHVVQRIRYAENETNYCPTCQTGGRVLADRSLSRLLKEDWPRTVEELEGE